MINNEGDNVPCFCSMRKIREGEYLGLCMDGFVEYYVNVIEEYQCNMSDKYKMRKIDMLKRSGKENECYVDE